MEYTFRHIKTGKIKTVHLSINEYDDYVAKHPKLERHIESAPGLLYKGTFDGKIPNGFQEVLAKVGESHPHSPLGNKYRKNKTIKQIKTREAVKKHALKLHRKLNG